MTNVIFFRAKHEVGQYMGYEEDKEIAKEVGKNNI
jgi:hypothetical protein